MNRANDGFVSHCHDEPLVGEMVGTEYAEKTKEKNEERGEPATIILRTTHDTLTELREQVEAHKRMLMDKYDGLAYRMSEVSISQQELMNEFEASIQNKSLAKDSQRLCDLWQTCCFGMAAFQTRLSDLHKLVNLSILPQARLTAVEASFVGEGQRIMEALQGKEKLIEAALPTKSSLIDKLSSRRKDVGIIMQNLAELDYDRSEEYQQREFLYDRGDRPEISDVRFEQYYQDTQRLTEWNLRQANAEIAELEKACIERGHDIAVPKDHPERNGEQFSATEPSNVDEAWDAKSHPSPVPHLRVTAWIEKLEGQDQDDPSQWQEETNAEIAEKRTSVDHGNKEH